MGVWDEKVPGKDPGPGAPNPAILELMKTLFQSNPAAGAPSGGGGGSVQMPSRVVTGPPAVTGPSPQNPNTPPSSAGAPSAMPAMPAGAAPQQAIPAYSGQMEFSTGAGRSGAVTSSAIGSVFGALHQITEKKTQDNIQHAQFLYDMVKTAQASGDEQTVNAVLGDPKKAKLIEKYLTGELPRLKGGQAQGKGGQGGPPPKVNQPGGIALPRPNLEAQNAAKVQNIVGERLDKRDPATIEALLGPGSSLSAKDFASATRAKFGLELSPVQVAAMSQEAQLALQAAQADVLKTLMGKEEDLKRATAVEKMRGESSAADVKSEVSGRMGVAKLTRDSIERVASKYRDLQKELKGTAPDKMDQVIFKGQADMYKTMAKDYEDNAQKYEKDGKKDLAADLRAKSVTAAKKAEDLGTQYEATKAAREVMKGIDLPGLSDGTE